MSAASFFDRPVSMPVPLSTLLPLHGLTCQLPLTLQPDVVPELSTARIFSRFGAAGLANAGFGTILHLILRLLPEPVTVVPPQLILPWPFWRMPATPGVHFAASKPVPALL